MATMLTSVSSAAGTTTPSLHPNSGGVPAQSLADLVECPICFCSLDEQADPRALRCLHTFCRRCLQNYHQGRGRPQNERMRGGQTMTSSSRSRDTSSRSSSTSRHSDVIIGLPVIIPCPVCCQETRLHPHTGISGLPHNFHTARIMDLIRASTESIAMETCGSLSTTVAQNKNTEEAADNVPNSTTSGIIATTSNTPVDIIAQNDHHRETDIKEDEQPASMSSSCPKVIINKLEPSAPPMIYSPHSPQDGERTSPHTTISSPKTPSAPALSDLPINTCADSATSAATSTTASTNTSITACKTTGNTGVTNTTVQMRTRTGNDSKSTTSAISTTNTSSDTWRRTRSFRSTTRPSSDPILVPLSTPEVPRRRRRDGFGLSASDNDEDSDDSGYGGSWSTLGRKGSMRRSKGQKQTGFFLGMLGNFLSATAR